MVDKYAQYIKERENLDCYEDEYGFFTYKKEDGVFLVSDLFVLPEYRNKGIGEKYAKKIDDFAKEHGCDIIVCTTCLDAINWEQSHKFIKSSGYHEVSLQGPMIYYKKELNHG